jgi:hypothetical protein
VASQASDALSGLRRFAFLRNPGLHPGLWNVAPSVRGRTMHGSRVGWWNDACFGRRRGRSPSAPTGSNSMAQGGAQRNPGLAAAKAASTPTGCDCAAAGTPIRSTVRVRAPRGCIRRFNPKHIAGCRWRAGGVTPFQGYGVLLFCETQGCTLGYRITHLRCYVGLRPYRAVSRYHSAVSRGCS